MHNHRFDDRPIAMGSILLSIVMLVVGFIQTPIATPLSDCGICFTSPDLWNLRAVVRFLLNTILFAGCAVALLLLNREYLFVRNADLMLPSLFLLLVVSVPEIIVSSTATLQLVVLTVVASLLIPLYKYRRPETNLFIAGTFISIGIMCSAGMILAIPFLFFMANSVGALSLRSIGALLLGLFSPWWIVLGAGLVPISELHFPEIHTIFNLPSGAGPDLVEWFFLGLTALIGFLALLGQEVQTYSGNARSRRSAHIFLWIFLFSSLGILLDTTQWQSYTATLCLSSSVGIAQLLSPDNHTKTLSIMIGVTLLYILIFTASLTLLSFSSPS